MSSDNIKVSIKVRPLISREKNENCSKEWLIDEKGSLSSVSRGHVFNFDHIFDECSSNADVFEVIAKPIVENALNGINGTIFAYGQTSSGKTYCLSGGENDPGIVILVVNEIFKQINTSEMANREFLIRVGYIEIYNEKIYDLLDAKKTAIEKMFENQGEVKISQIEVMASSSDVMLEHFRRGNELKRTGETAMNERSSRSHSIFSITIESREKGSSGGECKVSTLNLVDLAGSERADQTKATGERLNESKHINQSLLALGKVIRELSSGTGDNGEKFISYRDSKLTRLLSASLGGNAKTAIICTITPATIDETLSTLNFANNAKTIKNKPKVNNIISERTMIAKLQNEILKLHHQLQEEKTKNSKLENINKIKNSIDERERQIIHGFNSNSNKINEMNRRRTWCPSTKEGCKENIFITSTPPSQLPPPPVILRNTEDGPQITFSFQSENLDELFRPADEVNFDEPIPNSQMTDEELARRIRTPKVFKKSVQLPDSPEIKLTSDMIKEEEIIKLKQMNEYLQNELQELQDFKRLEEFCDNDIKNQALFDKINQHEGTIVSLNALIDKQNSEMKELEVRFQLSENEQKKCVKERQEKENLLASIQYEYEQFKQKSKLREEELVNELNKSRNETVNNDLEKLRSEFETTSDQLMDALEDNEKLQQEISDIRDVLSEKVLKIQELQEKIDQHENIDCQYKKIEEILKNNQEVVQIDETDDLIEMITKLIDAAVKTESLETEKSQFIKEIEEIRSSAHELKESVELINKKCSTLNEEIQEKSQIIEKHEQEKLKLINDLENTNALKTSISLELETIKNNQSTAITEYQAQLDKLQTNLEDRLLELSNLEAKYQHITKENKDLIGKVTSLNDFIDKQKSEMKELEILNQLSENEQKKSIKEIQEKEKLLASIEQDYEQFKQNSKLREEELVNELNKSRNQTVNNDVEKLRSEFETISDQLINSLEDNAKLQQEFNEKILKIQELQEKIDQLEKIYCQYKKIEEILKNNQEVVQVDETDDLIEMITKLIDAAVKTESLETEKSQFLKEIEEMRSSSHELKESVELINKKCSTLNEEIQEKSQIIEKHEQEKLKLINDLENTNALKTSISLELETIKNNQSTAITEYQAQLDKLQTNLEDRLLELSNLEAKYQHITKENKDLIGKVTSLNDFIDKQKSEMKELEILNQLSENEQKKSIKEIQEKEKLLASIEQDYEQFKQNSKLREEELVNELNKSRNQTVNNDVEKLRSEFETISDQLINSLEDNAKLQQEFNEKILKIQELQEKIDQLEKIYCQYKKIEEILKNNQEVVQVDETDDLIEMITKLIDAAVKTESLETEKSQFLKEIEEMRSSSHELKESVELINKKCSTLNEEIQEKSQIIEKHEQEKLKLINDLKNTNALKTSISLELETIKNNQSTAITEYQAQLDKLQTNLEDRLLELSNLEAKYQHMTKENENLTKNMKIVNESLAQQTTENFNNAQIILDLHRKNKDMLTELQNYKDQPKKNVSPTQNRRSGENLENEAYALQRKQLQIESNHGTPVRAMKTNLDRKTRRQSVYDENRRLSSWELISSVETQTENVDDICACKENAEKIKELELEIRRKQIIINNNELMAKCNPLKVDLADIKMKYEREMRNNKLLKTSMESLEEELAKFRSQQHLTSQNLNLSSLYVAKTEYNKLFNEKISLEKKLNDAKRQRANSSEKENVGVNTSFNNIQSNDELDSLKKAHNELLRKYDMAKRLCNLRLDDLNTLRKELATKDDDIAVKDQEIMRMTNKYQEAKRICLLRMETIKSLRERLGEVPWTPLNPSEGFSHESDVTDKQA